MDARRPHAQHLCPRVLALPCRGFFTVTDIKGNVGAACGYESSDYRYQPMIHHADIEGYTLFSKISRRT